MPKATVFSFSSLSARASVLSSSAVGWKKKVTCTRLEADGGDGLGLLLQFGGRTALEHHAQADVVLGRFAGQHLERLCPRQGRSLRWS